MPEVTHSTEVRASVDATWAFVKNMDNWAPFVMGYQEHERLNDLDSIWVLKGDIGMLARTVRLRVHIVEWNGPTKVVFTMTGIDEMVEGRGVFEMGEGTVAGCSRLVFALRLTAGGLAGPVVNALLEPLLRPFADGLASKIVGRIESTGRT